METAFIGALESFVTIPALNQLILAYVGPPPVLLTLTSGTNWTSSRQFDFKQDADDFQKVIMTIKPKIRTRPMVAQFIDWSMVTWTIESDYKTVSERANQLAQERDAAQWLPVHERGQDCVGIQSHTAAGFDLFVTMTAVVHCRTQKAHHTVAKLRQGLWKDSWNEDPAAFLDWRNDYSLAQRREHFQSESEPDWTNYHYFPLHSRQSFADLNESIRTGKTKQGYEWGDIRRVLAMYNRILYRTRHSPTDSTQILRARLKSYLRYVEVDETAEANKFFL